MAQIPDYHVHTEWSYDAPHGSMERSCEKALEIGLPAIAFTDHADFVTVNPGQYCVDIVGYLEAVERCRSKFKGLRIHSGVELGEPHWFLEETRRVLSAGKLDHVLGSVHCVRLGDRIIDASQLSKSPDVDPGAFAHAFFTETLAMMCPSQTVLGWWRELGGAAISFGSDAHDPAKVAAGFEQAAEMVEAVGFKPAAEPTALWRR
ncbi:MAG: PHP domain-containing protein [Chloroflexi bacterium]|nr:MAG: PHP domain-containing protein [Chloroflexota bacterium]